MNPRCPRCKVIALNETDQFCYMCGTRYGNPTNVPLTSAQPVQPAQAQFQFQQPRYFYPQASQYIVAQQPHGGSQIGVILSCVFGVIGSIMVVFGLFVPFYRISASAFLQSAEQSYSLLNDSVLYSLIIGVTSLALLLLSIPALGYGAGEGILKIILSLVLVFCLMRISSLLGDKFREAQDKVKDVVANIEYTTGYYLILFGMICSIISGIIMMLTKKRG